MGAGSRQDPAARGGADPYWSSADPDQVVALLRSGDVTLDAGAAAAIRDRVASLVLSNPMDAHLISSAFIAHIQVGVREIEPVVRAIAWRAHAEASMFSGRMPDARNAYERATAAARGHDQLLGQILVGRIHLLSLLGDDAEARRLVQRAERLLRRAGDMAYLGKLYVNLGNVHYQRDEHAQAYQAYRKGLAIYDGAGIRDTAWVAMLVNQAIACTNLSRVAEAQRLFQEAETHCERMDLPLLCALARYNHAFLESFHGNHRTALQLLEDAGDVFACQEMHDMTAATLRGRAEIYLDLGMAAEARDLAAQSVEAFTAQDMALDAAISRLHWARGLILNGDVEAAGARLAEAEAFFAQRKNRLQRAAVLLLQARLALLRGDPSCGARLAGRAARTFARAKVRRSLSEAGRVRAEALLARNRPAEAERALAEARAGTPYLPAGEHVEVWHLAGRIARAAGRQREAQRRVRTAVRYVEAERRLIPGIELRARSFEERVQVLGDMIELTLEGRRPRFDALFQMVEAARARGFRERSGVRRPTGAEELDEQRAQLNSLTRRLLEAEYPEAGPPDLVAIRDLQRQARELESSLSDKLRRLEAREETAQPWRGTATPADVRRRLRADETVVEFFALRDRVLVLVLNRDQETFRVLDTPLDELSELVDRVRFQLDSLALAPKNEAHAPFQVRSARAVLGALYDALLRPLEDVLPAAGRLLVIPHRFLHRVPFECLYAGDDPIDHRFIVTRCPTADTVLRRRRSTSKRNVLLCGSIASGPAAVADELEAIRRHFEGPDVQVLRDPRAADVLANMERCRIVHLSTHGVFREDNPLFSRLATLDGGLFLVDLLGSRLTADLVVLSACNSGQVFTGKGDDLSGVAHGFLAAGARQLVASTWRVHDRATQDLMAAFYAHYTSDEARRDPGRALVAAARDVRQTWPHPFYWASFSVHGV